MEAKAIELFKRFSQVTVLYRTDDGEYFIELDDCQAYLTTRGSGTYSTVERTTPLPTLPTPWVEPPMIWGVINNPLAYNATPVTNPTLYPHILIYNVSMAGTYTNFRDTANNSLGVTSGDLESGLVQLRWEDGWKKVVVPVLPAGSVSPGETQAVSGDRVYNSVKSVSDRIDNITEEVVAAKTLPLGTDSGLQKNGSTIAALPGYKRAGTAMPNMVAIQPGFIYRYTGVIGNEHPNAVGVQYRNASNVFIGWECGEGVYTDFTLSPPSGTAYITISGKGTDPIIKEVLLIPKTVPPAGSVSLGETRAVSGDRVYNSVKSVSDRIDNITEEVVAAKTLPLGTDSGLQKNGSTIAALPGYKRAGTAMPNMVAIQPGFIYRYTGVIGNEHPNAVGVQYRNASNVFIGWECGEGVYTDFTLSPPPGTAYITISGKGPDPIIKEVAYVAKSSNETNVIYVDAGAIVSGDGSVTSPFKTIGEAITAIQGAAFATVIIANGDYRETLPFGLLTSGNFKFTNKEGGKVRILGSEKISGWTKTEGRTNIYQAAYGGTVPAWSRNGNPVFEDGRPSAAIDPLEYHPLQKNLSHRLPFTPIHHVASLDELDSSPGKYHLHEGVLYIHTSESNNPEENGYSYEIITRASNTFNSPASTTKKTSLQLQGLQFFFNNSGLNLAGFDRCRLENIIALATNASGAIRPNTGHNTLLYCEAGYCDGDGFNGHFSAFAGFASLGDNRSHSPTTVYTGCWAHDNFDDGESSHELHNVLLDSCLLEYNGDSGCRPSNDATYYVKDSFFRHNGWEVGHGSTGGKGEGFAVVNPVSGNPSRIGCRAILINCISENNNTGYGTISSSTNRIELISCVARNNSFAEYYAGLGVMILRNCKATNGNPTKHKVVGSGTMVIKNDEIVI